MERDAKPNLKRDLFFQQQDSSALLSQLYIVLERRFSQLEDGMDKDDVQDIEQLFKSRQTWSNARRIELRLITAMQSDMVPIYMKRYLVDAKRRFAKDKYNYYYDASKAIDAQKPQEAREVLLQLVEDLQEASVVRWMKKCFANRLAARTNIFFFSTAAIFVFLFTFNWPTTWDAAFYNLILCISGGLLGACFSMLTGMKKKLAASKLQELRNQTRYVNLLSRVTIGGGAALLLFFFAQSGLLGGKILPQFQHEPLSEDKIQAKLEKVIDLHMKEDPDGDIDPVKAQAFITKCVDWLPRMRELSPTEAQKRIQDWMSRELAAIWEGKKIEPQEFQKVLNGFTQSMWDLIRKPGYLDNAARAQMLILCILVGFSEKLVPDLLNRAEGQVRGAAGEAHDPRRKPKDGEPV